MYITRALIDRKQCLDQAIQTRKSKLLSRKFFKNMAECCYFIKQLLYGFRQLDGLIQTLGKIARVKKSAKNHSITLATFLRVWIRPSKHGNHKVIV